MKNLAAVIDQAIKKAGGNWSIVVQKIGEEQPLYELNQDKKFYAASVNKVVIALYVLNRVATGNLRINERLKLTDKVRLPGTGTLKYLQSGLEPTFQDLLTLMLITSDNTAAKMLAKHFGVDKINSYLNTLGLKVTCLEKLPKGKFSYGYTTAGEYAQIMKKLIEGAYLPKKQNTLLLEIMTHNRFRYGLARYIEDDNPVKIAHKEGALGDMRHEVAVAWNKPEKYIVSAFSEKLPDERYLVDNAGVLALAEIGKVIFETLSHE